MQVIRQSLKNVMQRSGTLVRPTAIIQQIRLESGDPQSSTSPDNHKSRHRSESQSGSDLNKSKGGDKKQRSSTTDDTQQPGATRKDWNNPNQVVGNDPQYGKGGSPTGADNSSQEKK